eukprot:894598-Pyramimonas_sp.AAC.1
MKGNGRARTEGGAVSGGVNAGSGPRTPPCQLPIPRSPPPLGGHLSQPTAAGQGSFRGCLPRTGPAPTSRPTRTPA